MLSFYVGRALLSENISKIQYLSVADTKIYKVTDIDFRNMAIEADETDLSTVDILENELFPIEEFGEFRIRMCNGGNSGGKGEIVNFTEWVKMRTHIL